MNIDSHIEIRNMIIKRSEISPIKMTANPRKEIANCGFKVINTDGFIYDYVGIGWVKNKKAEEKDYLNIPELID